MDNLVNGKGVEMMRSAWLALIVAGAAVDRPPFAVYAVVDLLDPGHMPK